MEYSFFKYVIIYFAHLIDLHITLLRMQFYRCRTNLVTDIAAKSQKLFPYILLNINHIEQDWKCVLFGEHWHSKGALRAMLWRLLVH